VKKIKLFFSLIYDSRDPIQIVKKDENKEYSNSTPEFTSISSSIDGYIVTGDAYGCLRIYDDISKAAKFKIDQFQGVSSNLTLNPKGDPIIGIDISVNREWVLWTTKSFLAIIHFDFNKNQSDPWSSKSQKPYALKLTLSKEQLEKQNLKEINFLPAKFDVGPFKDLSKKDILEHSVTTYTSNFRVDWNMRTISSEYKKQETVLYGKIKILDELVFDFVPEYGRPGSDESVVALADCVKHFKI